MSIRTLLSVAIITAFSMTPQPASYGRGFGGGGGGFHGGGGFGGGGFGGGAGGFGGASGFHGGYTGGFGGYGGGDRGGFGGYGAGGFGGGVYGAGGLGRDGFGAGGLGADGALAREGIGAGGLDGRAGVDGLAGRGGYGAAPSRSQLNSFLGLPSDEGLHNMISNPYVHGGSLAGDNFNVQHGSVEGPRGGEAAGTVVEGPRGNEAARGAAVGPDGGVVAGRGVEGAGGGSVKQGIAAGPGGRVAGGTVARGPEGGVAARGFAAGPHGYAAGFVRVSPSDRYRTASFARGNFHDWNSFGPGWYTDHPGAWFAAGWVAGRCWYPCTWAAFDDWFAYPIAEPIYYDYGNTVTYQDDGVYVDGQDAGTPQEYYDQAQQLATTGAQADAPSDGDWMPLGVFLLTKTGAQDSHDVFQLAVNKQGIIRGNFEDTADKKTEPVQGSIDLKTQRVAFTVGDKTSTIIETGLYNLTKDEAPVLIHFGQDRTEQWLLVRLKNPDTPAPAAPTDGSQDLFDE